MIQDPYPYFSCAQNSPFSRYFPILKTLTQKKTSVLLRGESGTGKEICARYLHQNSPRKKAPFIAVNCGAINENLMESELFGHVKGSFSGAYQDQVGKIVQAHQGTLFLDEIAELSLHAQTRLLRVLQERTVSQVGSPQEQYVDFRLICATHQNLEELIAKKRFRADLFYRINIFPLFIPNLLERKMDIPLLAKKLWKQIQGENQTHFELNSQTIQGLQERSWSGNVRELRNWLERFQIECESATNLFVYEEPTMDYQSNKKKWQYESSQQLLEKLRNNQFNKTRTAQEMGISRGSLDYQLKKLHFA